MPQDRRQLIAALAGSSLAVAADAAYALDRGEGKKEEDAPLAVGASRDCGEPFLEAVPLADDAIGALRKLAHLGPAAKNSLPAKAAANDELARQFAAVYGTIDQLAQSLASGTATHPCGTAAGGLDAPLPSIRIQLVEQALSHSQRLLQEARSELREASELRARMLSLALELIEYQELDEIHMREVAAGFYDVPVESAHQDYLAERAGAIGREHMLNLLDGALRRDHTPQSLIRQVTAAQESAWFSHLSSYQPNKNNLLTYQFDGAASTIPSFLQTIACVQASFGLRQTQVGSVAALIQTATDLAASERRADSSRIRAEWQKEDRTFRSARTEVARRLANLKLEAAVKEGGALNFLARAKAASERAESLREFAKGMLESARLGLELVFGPAAAHLRSGYPASDRELLLWLSEASEWATRAQEWVRRIDEVDQEMVVPVSLKAICGRAGWKRGLIDLEWKFEVNECVFEGSYLTRLRGVAAYIPGSARSQVWRAKFLPPTQGTYVMADRSCRRVSQEVPPCQLGRIVGRRDRFAIEAGGTGAFWNASPIGSWAVQLAPIEGLSARIAPPDDLIVEFLVAGIPVSESIEPGKVQCPPQVGEANS